MHRLADQLPFPYDTKLHMLAEETWRRKPQRKAPSRAEPKVTRAQIVRFFATHPGANNMDAAHFFGVNNRAISYAYAGRRT